ncbi:MAG: hypothetical protein AcusKO_44500 [Acuticoccus sp.]
MTDPSKPFNLSRPSADAVALIKRAMARADHPVIAEIGIGYGATSIETCRLLANRGRLYLFDYEDKLSGLQDRLDTLGFFNVIYHGNSRKLFDSYNWNLANLLRRRLRAGGDPALFDFVYLDGAHSFHHDAPAAMIVKDLMKPGGEILFDDYDWSFATSRTMNPDIYPAIRDQYSDEQIDEPHVALLCELFFDADPAFQQIDIGYSLKEHRRAYRKIGQCPDSQGDRRNVE